MKERDSITEEAIKEVAEILAKGYVKLMMRRREDQSGAAAGNAAGRNGIHVNAGLGGRHRERDCTAAAGRYGQAADGKAAAAVDRGVNRYAGTGC